MNKFFAKVVEFFKKLFGKEQNMELPKIEMVEQPKPQEPVPNVKPQEPGLVGPVDPQAYTGYKLVAVRPTGVHGVGKVRWYPAARGTDGENLFGYLANLGNTFDPTTGSTFLNAQAKAELANLMLNPGALPRNPVLWPSYADALNFPDDWRSQEQLDAMNPAKQENPYYDNPISFDSLSDEDKIYLHAMNRTYRDSYFYFLRGTKTDILRFISEVDSNFAVQSAEYDVNNYSGHLRYWTPQAIERWTKDHAKRG